MGQVCIKIQDGAGMTKAVSRSENEVNLVYSDEYQEGDRIIIEIEEKQIEWLQMDRLSKGEEEGAPFPALSQIEVYGKMLV